MARLVNGRLGDLGGHVAPGAADGWRNVLGDPAFEVAGLGLLAAHDERVNARLVHQNRRPAAQTYRNNTFVCVIDVATDVAGHILVTEDGAGVGGREPGLAVDLDGAELEGRGEVEGLDLGRSWSAMCSGCCRGRR